MQRNNARVGSLMCVAILLGGCEADQPLAPVMTQAASGGSGPPVAAPSDVQVVAVSDSRIDVAWVDNTNKETGFEVYRSASGDEGGFTRLASLGSNVTTYSDVGTGVDPSTPYCYQVRAYKVVQRRLSLQFTYSDFSNTACAPAGDVQLTAATTGVDLDPDGYRVQLDALMATGALGLRSVTLGVNESTTIAGLRVGDYYRASLGGVFANCNVSSTDPQSITVTGGNTTAVTWDVACEPLMSPAAPSYLTATGYFLGHIRLEWRDLADNEDGFKIERCDLPVCGDTNFALIATVPAVNDVYRFGSYWDVVGFVPEIYYFTYRVRATNRAGDSAPVTALGRTCVEGYDDEAPCY